MKIKFLNVSRLAVLSLWVIALSGCALGGRVRATRTQEPAQAEQSQYADPTAFPLGDPSNVSAEATAPGSMESASQTASPGDTSDPLGDELLNLIDSLDAANQSADLLEDIP